MAMRPANPMNGNHRAKTARGLWVLPAALCLFVSGCQQGNQQVYQDIYQRELRLQEDEIYRLEDCIKEYQGLIRGYRVEMEEMKTRLDSAGKTGAAIEPRGDRTRSVLDQPDDNRLDRLPRDVFDEPTQDDLPGIDVPEIDLGEPAAAPTPPPIEPPSIDRTPLETLPLETQPLDTPPIDVPPLPNEPANERYEPSEELPLPLGEAPAWDAAPPAAALLPPEPLGDAQLSSYAGPRLESGEATLIALLWPSSLTGDPTAFDGECSLMLIQPQRDRKLARWDFTADEVAQSWRDETSQPVLDLAVVLPEEAPRDEPLELWARLVDQHGEKVLKRVEVVLDQLAAAPGTQLAEADQPSELTPGAWRASSHPMAPAPRVAVTQPSDSGWNNSDTPREPRQIDLASHEEEAKPLPTPPPAWAPSR